MKNKILVLILFLLGVFFFYIFASYIENNRDITIWLCLYMSQSCFLGGLHYLKLTHKEK